MVNQTSQGSQPESERTGDRPHGAARGSREAPTLAVRGAAAGLRTAFDALTRLRSGRPIHAVGSVRHATLTRYGTARPWGVPWLDGTGEHAAVVRSSRGLGLPPGLPDLLGLAVRVDDAAGPVDVLLGSTGIGPLGRRLLLPRRGGGVRASSTIVTYASAAGRVRLAAVPEREDAVQPVYVLAAAVGSDVWDPFARLEVGGDEGDSDITFDPVLNSPPGLVPDGLLSRVRTPAYVVTRRRRHAPLRWSAR